MYSEKHIKNCIELQNAIKEFKEFYDSIEELKIDFYDYFNEIIEFNKVAPKNKKKIKEIFNSYGFKTVAKRDDCLLVR